MPQKWVIGTINGSMVSIVRTLNWEKIFTNKTPKKRSCILNLQRTFTAH